MQLPLPLLIISSNKEYLGFGLIENGIQESQNAGTYETTATYASTAAASGGYRVILSNISFPAIFTAAPIATASHNGSSSHYWGAIANVSTGLSSLSVALDRGNAVTSGAVKITFNLKGTWK